MRVVVLLSLLAAVLAAPANPCPALGFGAHNHDWMSAAVPANFSNLRLNQILVPGKARAWLAG